MIAVEGYVDVVAMHAAGFPETGAGLGTALTAEQAALLWTMSPEPILCFDGDKAGRKAAYRAADTALPLIGPSKTLSFALLPEGQDPDDLLRAAGCTVHEAMDGRAALELAFRVQPDLVISDILMPGMDGLEVAARVRRSEAARSLAPARLVVLSADLLDTERRTASYAGVDAILGKPVSFARLGAAQGLAATV